MRRTKTKRRRLLLVAVAAAFAVAACGGGDDGGEPAGGNGGGDGLTQYVDVQQRFDFQYPSDWDDREGVGGSVIAVLSPPEGEGDTFRENVNVVVETVSPDQRLDEYTDLTMANLRRFIKDMDLIDSGSTTLGGEPAHQVLYTGATSGVQGKFLQVWAIHETTAYVVTYTGSLDNFEEFEDEAQTILDSFNFR